MRILAENNLININERLDMPSLIQKTNDTAFMDGNADEPFYICDLSDIIAKHNLWLKKFPKITPFYAVKCNPDSMVLKIFAKLGLGFDCATKQEISVILKNDVSPDRIVYAHPCKQVSHIKYARTHGVKLITFDSEVEIKKMKHHYPEAQLLIRIFVGSTKARCPLGLKFGAAIEDVQYLLSLAYSCGLNVVGVSFHVGSGCFDPSAYRSAIQTSYSVFKIAEAVGYSFNILDLGGGFPGNFDTEENTNLFEDVCATINQSLNDYFPGDSVKFIAEPGRFYVSSAYHLACTVTTCRAGKSEDGMAEVMSYFINDGVYGSFNCIVFDHYIGQHYLLRDSSGQDSASTYQSTLWGPTCDSADKVLDNFRIRKIEPGEIIVFKNMGAYTVAAASNFNGFRIPYIRYASTFEAWLSIKPVLISAGYRLEEWADSDQESGDLTVQMMEISEVSSVA